MRSFTVYRVDYVKRYKTPIGNVVERRKKTRPDNVLGLLKIARKTFGFSPDYNFHIVLDKNVLKGP